MAEFSDTTKAMSVMNLQPEEQWEVLKLVACVLHLGNIDFAENGNYAQVRAACLASPPLATFASPPHPTLNVCLHNPITQVFLLNSTRNSTDPIAGHSALTTPRQPDRNHKHNHSPEARIQACARRFLYLPRFYHCIQFCHPFPTTDVCVPTCIRPDYAVAHPPYCPIHGLWFSQVRDANFLQFPAYLMGVDAGLLNEKLTTKIMESRWGGQVHFPPLPGPRGLSV